MAVAVHRFTKIQSSAPLFGQFYLDFYSFFTIVVLKNFSAASMKQWCDTTGFLKILLPLAEIGNNGFFWPQNWNKQPILGALLRTCSSIWAAYRFRNIYIYTYTLILYVYEYIHICTWIYIYIYIHIHPGGPESEVVNYCFFFQKSSFCLGENTKIQTSEFGVFFR